MEKRTDPRRPQRPARLAYEKPHLRTLDLAAEEVLAVGCKMATASGPIPPTCLSSVCSADGS